MIYNPILSSEPLTVLSEFNPETQKHYSYQSEEQLEKEFIEQLKTLSYQYLPLKTKSDLKNNLRVQLEKLNSFRFTDHDWEDFYLKEIENPQKGIKEKTKLVQSEKVIITYQLSDGTNMNIKLLDKEDISKNTLQVINQFEAERGKHKNRYDVTILVNGLPLVHIELKRRGVAIREAFNQINRYGRESFWSEELFDFVQLFIISNGANTLYYSNTTRLLKSQGKNVTSTTWKNTCNWADFKNNPIHDLSDFTSTFLNKRTLLNVIFRYCVYNTKEELMVMRPYQICATESILSQVNIAEKNNLFGSISAGGYIWHTTGSGKTLTSFKTAQLLTENPNIKKVFFVVDRCDLDHQTIQEYNKFEDGCVVENKSTKELEKQISSDKKIVVTTIQKLSNFVKGRKDHPLFKEKVVIIFDECHRSQFGEMHSVITDKFKKYAIFGFTGTPILAENTNSMATTESSFGRKLHTYTIQNAINDGKVLRFKIDYVQTMKEKENIKDEEVPAIDTEAALLSDERLDKIVEYIEKHYKRKTDNGRFNSILACQSVEAAKRYYTKLKDKFTVATIYSYKANEEISVNLDEEVIDDTSSLDQTSKDFLNSAIADYNAKFSTSFNANEQFQAYYRDLSKKVKDKKIDILIVVNMFLTGFDAPFVNTLWVDKNLQYHGLLQAFSRTNRTVNDLKPHGNIVCFRPLEENVNKSIRLFGDENAQGIVIVRPFKELNAEYKSIVDEFLTLFPNPKVNLVGETERKTFIQKFSLILSKRNILLSFDEFKPFELIPEGDFESYTSRYLDERDIFMHLNKTQKESILDDIVFEIELLKTTEVNVDYILKLISEKLKENTPLKVLTDTIVSKAESSILLRSKKKLIEEFLNNIDPNVSNFNAEQEWYEFINEKKVDSLEEIIATEGLDPDATKKLIENSLRKEELNLSGDVVPKLFINTRTRLGLKSKKDRVTNLLVDYFNKYL